MGSLLSVVVTGLASPEPWCSGEVGSHCFLQAGVVPGPLFLAFLTQAFPICILF